MTQNPERMFHLEELGHSMDIKIIVIKSHDLEQDHYEMNEQIEIEPLKL